MSQAQSCFLFWMTAFCIHTKFTLWCDRFVCFQRRTDSSLVFSCHTEEVVHALYQVITVHTEWARWESGHTEPAWVSGFTFLHNVWCNLRSSVTLWGLPWQFDLIFCNVINLQRSNWFGWFLWNKNIYIWKEDSYLEKSTLGIQYTGLKV